MAITCDDDVEHHDESVIELDGEAAQAAQAAPQTLTVAEINYGLSPPIDGKQYAGSCKHTGKGRQVSVNEKGRLLGSMYRSTWAQDYSALKFRIPPGVTRIGSFSPFKVIYDDGVTAMSCSCPLRQESPAHYVRLADHPRLAPHVHVTVRLLNPVTGSTLKPGAPRIEAYTDPYEYRGPTCGPLAAIGNAVSRAINAHCPNAGFFCGGPPPSYECCFYWNAPHHYAKYERIDIRSGGPDAVAIYLYHD